MDGRPEIIGELYRFDTYDFGMFRGLGVDQILGALEPCCRLKEVVVQT